MSRPQPFLEAAAQAMGINQLNVIGGKGMDPLTAPRQQWNHMRYVRGDRPQGRDQSRAER